MRLRSRRAARIARVGLLVGLLAGCLDTHAWKPQPPPWNSETVAREEQVQVEDASGRHYVLDQPRIGRDERGEFLAGRIRELGGKEVRLDLADVRVLEVQELDVGETATAVLAGIVVLAGLVIFLIYG
jgi:hypothetical protein